MPDRPLDEGYRIELYTEDRAADVIALWAREGVLGADEARRRVHEVLLVATHTEGGEPVGVSSAYLQRNSQLGMDLWYYRAFVAAAHRESNVAVTFAVMGRENLKEAFVTGRDVRGAGVCFEVENAGLKRRMNRAVWRQTDFAFIGENARGDHVRVHFFPGARAPLPPA